MTVTTTAVAPTNTASSGSERMPVRMAGTVSGRPGGAPATSVRFWPRAPALVEQAAFPAPFGRGFVLDLERVDELAEDRQALLVLGRGHPGPVEDGLGREDRGRGAHGQGDRVGR